MLVSAATGAVGGAAVQLAKAAGARVVAIAGGRDRTDHAEQVLARTLRSTTVTQRSRSVLRRRRAKLLRVVVSEFEGPDRAPQALATVFDRGSPYIGRRVVRVSEG